MKTYKPTSQGQRARISADFKEITRSKPEKSLLAVIKSKIDSDCSSTCSRTLFSLESSYKAKEYLSLEVIENPLFLLNLVPLLCRRLF